jgi:probable S-adenosylmethionine-dependent methyltransferase, YraL family
LSKLYIIGSPIGNLEDITIRAVDILKNLEYVFSEDTRISSKLMKKFDINTSLLPIYTSKKELNKNKFLDLITKSDIGFLTDAGSPGVSDPAGEFVKIARNNNHEIIPIPGVSSVTSAFSVSGLESIGFSFLGFLPKSDKQKLSYLEQFSNSNNPIVIFESPRRIINTFRFIRDKLNISEIFVAKEMTKIYETIFQGPVDEAIKKFSNEKGEFVIIFKNENNQISNSFNKKYDKILIDGYEKGIKGKKLLDLLSELTKTKKSFFYDRWLDIKNQNGK